MPDLSRLRRGGILLATDALAIRFARLKTRFYYSPQFAAIGTGSVVRRPLLVRNPRGITIGSDTMIRQGARLEVVDRPGLPPGTLVIGDRVNFEQNVHVATCDNVWIGDDVSIAAGCVIVDTTHPIGRPGDGSRARHVSAERTHVHLGNRVFVGANSVILAGVTIGENSIVGAGSVVTRDVPPNSIAAGVPARVVRTLAEDS